VVIRWGLAQRDSACSRPMNPDEDLPGRRSLDGWTSVTRSDQRRPGAPTMALQGFPNRSRAQGGGAPQEAAAQQLPVRLRHHRRLPTRDTHTSQPRRIGAPATARGLRRQSVHRPWSPARRNEGHLGTRTPCCRGQGEYAPECTHWFEREGEIVCRAFHERTVLASQTLVQCGDAPASLDDGPADQ